MENNWEIEIYYNIGISIIENGGGQTPLNPLVPVFWGFWIVTELMGEKP